MGVNRQALCVLGIVLLASAAWARPKNAAPPGNIGFKAVPGVGNLPVAGAGHGNVFMCGGHLFPPEGCYLFWANYDDPNFNPSYPRCELVRTDQGCDKWRNCVEDALNSKQFCGTEEIARVHWKGRVQWGTAPSTLPY